MSARGCCELSNTWVRLAVLFVVLSLSGACASAPPLILTLSGPELRQKVEDDLIQIRRYDEGLTRTLDYAAAHPELFPKGKTPVELPPTQKEELRGLYRQMLDYLIALDGLKRFWQEFPRLNVTVRPEEHAMAFQAGYMAWLVQYRHGLRFMDMSVPNATLEVVLDEAMPDLGIPSGSFGGLKLVTINIASVIQLHAGREYFGLLKKTLGDSHCGRAEPCQWAMGNTEAYASIAQAMLEKRALGEFSYNAMDIVRDTSFKAWFPLQKEVAEWMGDTRVHRLHKHLITKDQIGVMQTQMRPGDIVVARHNWYLSNIGLPGFWPHAILYLGSPEELSDAFADPAFDEAFPRSDPGTPGFISHLAETYPTAWASYSSPDREGAARRVIEAISEGVLFNSLEHAAGADYVGVMRPRFDALDTARAIDAAFANFGKPYDFNFDFLTDEALVCTELVYKAWRPEGDKKGPALTLTKVVGRTTLPANHIVSQFDRNYGTEHQHLDFVYFLDGREGKGKALVADLAAFRRSWRRPQWDILQK